MWLLPSTATGNQPPQHQQETPVGANWQSCRHREHQTAERWPSQEFITWLLTVSVKWFYFCHVEGQTHKSSAHWVIAQLNKIMFSWFLLLLFWVCLFVCFFQVEGYVFLTRRNAMWSGQILKNCIFFYSSRVPCAFRGLHSPINDWGFV